MPRAALPVRGLAPSGGAVPARRPPFPRWPVLRLGQRGSEQLGRSPEAARRGVQPAGSLLPYSVALSVHALLKLIRRVELRVGLHRVFTRTSRARLRIAQQRGDQILQRRVARIDPQAFGGRVQRFARCARLRPAQCQRPQIVEPL